MAGRNIAIGWNVKMPELILQERKPNKGEKMDKKSFDELAAKVAEPWLDRIRTNFIRKRVISKSRYEKIPFFHRPDVHFKFDHERNKWIVSIDGPVGLEIAIFNKREESQIYARQVRNVLRGY